MTGIQHQQRLFRCDARTGVRSYSALTSSQVVPDSHDRTDVRTAAESIRLLAERVGPVHTEERASSVGSR